MTDAVPLRFKLASEPAEFEQIHRLNHRTFTQEIPQHAPRDEGLLVDRFHGSNTYVICLRGERLVGMICLRGERPFSLDAKLQNLDAHLPPGRSPCEIRLLAVEPEHRTGTVFRGLVEELARHSLAAGYDLALISGTERQLRLYRHLGFVPFGPRVGAPGAWFQPMFLTLETFRAHGSLLSRWREPASFLPGPVEMAPEVRQAFMEQAVSHRGRACRADVADVRRRLCALTGARRVQLLLGSGTLANDAVAARISLLGGAGIVLSSGEFGERLADHAVRWRLPATVHRLEWGAVITRELVEAALSGRDDVRWLWLVHCETSTGVLNDLPMLREVCAGRGIHLCLDCISSLGTTPVDLRGVHLASAASGKGLGSFAGLALVFHDDEISAPAEAVPRYLDLGLYAIEQGIPFTQSSNLVGALRAALAGDRAPCSRFAATAADSEWIRAQLRQRGFHVVAPDAHASPAVITVELPPSVRSTAVGAGLERENLHVSCRSGYLRRRNWIQICLMGAYRRDRLAALVDAFERAARESRPRVRGRGSPAWSGTPPARLRRAVSGRGILRHLRRLPRPRQPARA